MINKQECGIYVTTVALSGKEKAVPVGCMVYFHHHSQEGPPIVLLPKANHHNRWTFNTQGYLVEGVSARAFIEGLKALPKEGLYLCAQAIQLTNGVLPARTLVQLGYNRRGEPILFPARSKGNGFEFPERGFRFASTDVLERLEPANFKIPGPPKSQQRVLH